MGVQRTDCRAREAESLEQAKHTDDAALKSLYTTIAKQWQLLAEENETRRPFALGGFYNQSAPISEPEEVRISQMKAGAGSKSANAGPMDHLDDEMARKGHADDCTKQVQDSGAQIQPTDQLAELRANEKSVESTFDQISQTVSKTQQVEGDVAWTETHHFVAAVHMGSQADSSGNRAEEINAYGPDLIVDPYQQRENGREPERRSVEIWTSPSETEVRVTDADAESSNLDGFFQRGSTCVAANQRRYRMLNASSHSWWRRWRIGGELDG